MNSYIWMKKAKSQNYSTNAYKFSYISSLDCLASWSNNALPLTGNILANMVKLEGNSTMNTCCQNEKLYHQAAIVNYDNNNIECSFPVTNSPLTIINCNNYIKVGESYRLYSRPNEIELPERTLTSSSSSSLFQLYVSSHPCIYHDSTWAFITLITKLRSSNQKPRIISRLFFSLLTMFISQVSVISLLLLIIIFNCICCLFSCIFGNKIRLNKDHIIKLIHDQSCKQKIFYYLNQHIQMTYLLPIYYKINNELSRASSPISRCFYHASMSISQHSTTRLGTCTTEPINSARHIKHNYSKNLNKRIIANRQQTSGITKPRAHCDEWTQLAKFVIITMTILSTINLFDVCDAKVKIHQIKVPKYIENGTMDSVLLDCQYSLDPDTDRNLVVKWFFKEDPEPIYQWIVEHDLRRVPQRYQGRVNPNYRAPNQTEPWQQYRSLNLIRPTVEMTGRYSCHVISITSEAHDADTMIVYAKTKSIDLVTRRVTRQRSAALKSSNGWSVTNNSRVNFTTVTNGIQSDRQHQSDYPGHSGYSGYEGWSSSAAGLSSSRLFDRTVAAPLPSIRPNQAKSSQNHFSVESREHRGGHAVTVTEIECSVENVYPLPELTIYQVLGDGTPNTQRPRSLEKARVQQNSTQLSNGAFRVSMIVSIDDEDLLMMSDSADNSEKAAKVSTNVEQQQQAVTKVAKPTMFECLVAQDELKHELRKSTIFVPNLAQSWNEPNNNGVNGSSSFFFLTNSFTFTIILMLMMIIIGD